MTPPWRVGGEIFSLVGAAALPACVCVCAAVLNSMPEFEIMDTIGNYNALQWQPDSRDWLISTYYAMRRAGDAMEPIDAPETLGKAMHGGGAAAVSSVSAAAAPRMLIHIAPGVKDRDYVASLFAADDITATVAPFIPIPSDQTPQLTLTPEAMPSPAPVGTRVLVVVMHSDSDTGLFDWSNEPRPSWAQPWSSMERTVSPATFLGWLVTRRCVPTAIVFLSCSLSSKEMELLGEFCKRTRSTLYMPSKASVAYTAKSAAAKADLTLVEFGKLAVRLARLAPAQLPVEAALRMASAMRCPALVIDANGTRHYAKPSSSPDSSRLMDAQPGLASTGALPTTMATAVGVAPVPTKQLLMPVAPSPSSEVPHAMALLLELATTTAAPTATAGAATAATAATAAPAVPYGRAPIGRNYSAPAISTAVAAGGGRKMNKPRVKMKLVPSSAMLPPPDETRMEDCDDVLFITAGFSDPLQSATLQIIAFLCKGMEAADGPPFAKRIKNMARRMAEAPLSAIACVISDSDARRIASLHRAKCTALGAIPPELDPKDRRVFLLGGNSNCK